MTTFTVYTGAKDGHVKPNNATKPEQLTGDQVFLRITASGMCFTDVHYVSDFNSRCKTSILNKY